MITSINEFRKINEESQPVEQIGRITPELAALLNAQIKNELMSCQMYNGMTCWLDDNGWIGASKYYFKAAQEELVHMNKVYQYLFDRNVRATVPTTDPVTQVFSAIREVVEASLLHEMEVTKQWETISNNAKNAGDHTTLEFAQWFLKEQIEEEEKFRNILFKMDLDMPKWKIDELFENK